MVLGAIWAYLNKPINIRPKKEEDLSLVTSQYPIVVYKEQPKMKPSIIDTMPAEPQSSWKDIRRYFSYVSHSLSLNSAVDLLPLFAVGQHNTAKEIAESWAMFQAILEHIRTDTRKGQGKVRVIVVGDGATARTGALIAYMTKWTVDSYDPNFNELPTCGVRVDRLQTYKMKVEEAPVTTYDEDLIILFPHAHASADIALDRFRTTRQRSLIVCPCCYPGTQLPTTDKKPIIYRDTKMMTAMNELYVWKKI